MAWNRKTARITMASQGSKEWIRASLEAAASAKPDLRVMIDKYLEAGAAEAAAILVDGTGKASVGVYAKGGKGLEGLLRVAGQ